MSSVVIDANVLLAFAADDDIAVAVGQQLDSWAITQVSLHAPALFQYEVASGAHAIGGQEVAEKVGYLVETLDIQLYDPPSIIELARYASDLGQRKAYDAAYVQLAVQLNTQLYTLDKRLHTSAAQAGLPVHLINAA